MRRILAMLISLLCVVCMWSESLTYDFSDLGDQKEVPVTTVETDAFTLEFDKGSSATQPIYYKEYSRQVYLQPGNTMKVIAKGSAQIAKIIFSYNVLSTSFAPDYGTAINDYGEWEIPAGHSTVVFTAFETPQSQEISLSEIEVIYYEQPVIPYCNTSEVKNGSSIKINSPGAESLRIIKPDGSFEDLTCAEAYPINHASFRIEFPLQAEQTSIDVYPIQRNWHYSNLKTTITLAQIFDEHNTTDIKVGDLYYKIITDSEGNTYAEVQSDGRYRDLTEITIPDYISTADGLAIAVKAIKSYAFNACQYLKKIILPPTLNEIGYNAFKGCSALENIDIPESVTYIGYGAFANCKSLKTIIIPKNLKEIRTYGYSDRYSPIKGCKSLTNVVLPNNDSGTGIYWQYQTASFLEGCNSVKEFIIPDNVTGLSDDFFKGNESVKKITFGANFSQFPSSIIDLPNLTELIFGPANNNYKEVDGALYCNSGQDNWKLVWLRKLPEDGILRLIDTSTGIQSGALKGYTLQEVIYPATLTSIGGIEQLTDCRVEKLVLPGSLEYLGTGAFRYSNIGTLVIEEGESPIIMDARDTNRENDGVFHDSKIDNLIINRDIDNINNYSVPVPHTKAFYLNKIRTVTINASLGENACGILSDATVSTIKLGPDVMSLYALGNHECSNIEIYSTSDINAPFNTNKGPLNTKYEFKGLTASNIYVYPTQLDKYKSIFPYKNVLPLPGTSSIQFGELTKTIKPSDTYKINLETMPNNLNLEWTSSNTKAAVVSEDGVVSALAEGATIITAKCIDKGYEQLSQSMTVYVSENAELEPDEAYLTIKGLGNHSSRHCYKKGSVAVIDIIPDEGWNIHTITLNGEDISATLVNNTILTPELYGENELNIVFKTEVVTGNAQIKKSNVKILHGQNDVKISGIAQDSVILIYDLSGNCIYKGTNHTISLEKNKYYILKVDDMIFKFIL